MYFAICEKLLLCCILSTLKLVRKELVFYRSTALWTSPGGAHTEHYLETTTRVTGSTLKKPRVLHHKTPGLMEHLGGEHSTGATVVREQERFLPVANISRIMKKALPANAKIAKDAKETVQECVSEFISFVTSE